MKPSYKLLTMQEIAAIEPNGFSVASTFSGCGGSSLGYKLAGYNVRYACEFIPAAQETYAANFPHTHLDKRDIREVRASEILSAIGLGVGELDILDGSPPCASFSTAGKREKGWGVEKSYSDTKQRTDDLFYEYARLLKDLQPKVFVAENVSGLVKGVAKGYFLRILERLKAAGYSVSARLLDAQYLGVPQQRQRVIFVGVRADLGLSPVFPKPLPYRYSVRDALPHIVRHECMASNHTPAWKDASEPSSTISQAGNFSKKQSAYTLVQAEPSCNWSTESSKFDRTIEASEPSPTIMVHGRDMSSVRVKGTDLETRCYTISELKRICAFPEDFVLTGTFAQQWERLGRSVPPVMMSHVAMTVRDSILKLL